MIKANELRIGNYLQDPVSKTILKVIRLSEEKDSITCYVIDRSKYPLPNGWGMEPIPLTEEILVKCGFKRDGSYWTNSNLDIPIALTISKTEILLIPNSKYLGEIKYLHQLQNLYFALTNEELNFKP